MTVVESSQGRTGASESRLVIFLGPSLSHDDARQVAPDAILLPPVCQGDLLSACEAYSPDVVVIVDGEFGQTLSVWHKEILFALDLGIRVFGASSMGALRAAELDRFGMEGVGKVYRHYAEGFLTADEDVALLHSEAEYGWRPLTWPMVNVWATIAHLREAGLVDAAGCDALQAAADALHFSQRSRSALVRTLAEQGRDDSAELVEMFVSNFVDQKQLDALEAIGIALEHHLHPKPEHDTPLHLFGRIGEAMQSTDTLVPSATHPMRRYQLVNDVALHDPEFERLSQRALDRAVVLEYAYEAGVEPTADEIEAETARFFATIGVAPEQIPDWIEANDFMPGELERFLRDETKRRHMQRWALDVRLYERNRRLILDQLRFENRYVDAVKAASRRRQLTDSRLPVDWPTDSKTLIDLVVRHSIASKWRAYVDLETTASDHGFESPSGLVTALLDATAARQEASERRERLAKVLGGTASGSSRPTGEEPERVAARAAHGALESHQLTAIARAFVDLGVADAISAGNTTAEEIAAACEADADRMARFLRASRGAGFVTCDGDQWSLTLTGDVFRTDHDASLAAYARDLEARSLPAWEQLASIVRGADPADNESAGDADEAFSAATWALGADVRIAALFPEDFVGHIVDVGGGLGRTASAIASRCAQAVVSIVDRPDVADRARLVVDTSRIAVHTGSTFGGGADRVTMSRVLCTLPDAQALELLTAVRSWVADGAEVHVIDCIPGEVFSTATVDLFNLVRGGGCARDEQQWNRLAAPAGFTISRIDPFMGPFSDLVLVPT